MPPGLSQQLGSSKVSLEYEPLTRQAQQRLWRARSPFHSPIDTPIQTPMDFLKADYPCVADIIVVLKHTLATAADSDQECDLDELIYDTISLWDECFEDDNEWFNEDDMDLKDSLRDQVIEFIG